MELLKSNLHIVIAVIAIVLVIVYLTRPTTENFTTNCGGWSGGKDGCGGNLHNCWWNFRYRFGSRRICCKRKCFKGR